MTLTLDDLMVDDNIDVPDVSLLTTRDLKGTGVFDKLMTSVNLHLQKEFEANRIKGTDYADVYVSALGQVMAQSVQFLLGEQAADKQAELLVAQTANAVSQNITITKQNLKLDAEIALLNQKLFTEQAQILSTVDGNPVAGQVGKQVELLNQQKEGFIRAAEQKVLQTLVTTWSVRHTGEGAGNPASTINGLSNDNIKIAVNKALEGINTTPAA